MKIAFDIRKISPLSIDSDDYANLLFRIDLSERIEWEHAKDLWILFKTIIDGGALKIHVNMMGLEFIDSEGISILINSVKMIRKLKGDIVLTNVSSEVKNIFKMIKLSDYVKIFNTEGEVINYFSYI